MVFGVQHAFHGDLVSGLYAAADRAGYELALSAVTPDRDERRAVAEPAAGPLRGADPARPAGCPRPTSPSWPPGCRSWSSPAPCATAPSTSSAPPTHDGLQQAVDHLVGLGHRRIAHIDGGRAPGAADRRRGYRDAMRHHGLDAEIRILPGGLTEDDGAAAARALLDARPPADARSTVFNDRCATGVLDVLRRAGLAVPGDISVVGYDDSRLARLSHVDLTTIAQDTEQITTLAVARAIDRLDGTPVTERELVIPPHLVVRATTARLG